MSIRSLAGSTVTLVREGTQGRTTRTFRILREFTRGSSVICYTARPAEGGPVGVLREFCPKDTDTRHYVLHRGQDGFLYTAGQLPSADENFRRSRDEYTAAYHRLLNSERLREDELLQSFIPSFEIYYSEAEHPGYNGTVFIWTERVLKTFAELCEEIQKQPAYRPEYYLAAALNAVCTLAESVRALHVAGFIHRDIKPANFGFVRREDKVLTQTLMLFDIDSLWDTEKPMGATVGSEGYMAPEILHGEPDNRADIYSIGATLFSAIIITETAKENGFRYKDEFYDRLESMVDESALICASEQNSHPRLRQLLAKILRGCLHPDKKQRYRGCRNLIDDLHEALSYVLPPELALRNRAGERWILTDAESSFDRNRRKNSERLFRYQLYDKPIYRWGEPGSEQLRVMVLGMGNYGQRFTDVILSTCQLPGKRLSVTMVSSEQSDLQLYLKDRSMLTEFFSVNGSDVSEEKYCGCLDSRVCRLRMFEQPEETSAAVEELLRNEHPQYIFIALGSKNSNLAAAKLVAQVRSRLGMKFCVRFVWDDESCAEALPEDVFPTCVNADTAKMPVHAEIERMAFNLFAFRHRGEELDRNQLKRDFRKSEDHEEAVAQVVAIRYMLWSLGIDAAACKAEEAAAAFAALRKKEPGIRPALAQAEHRRWMTEKICAGWTRLQQFRADGTTKNERKKQHLCLVSSRVNEGLPRDDLYLWEQAPEEELQKLDELDRLSVCMHRYCREQAKNINVNMLDGGTAEAIRRMVGDSGPASSAFHELRCCMQDITGGDRDKVRFYRGLCNAFLDTLDTLPGEKAGNARRLFSELQREFAPAAENARLRDLKKDDDQLIDAVPYILTYTPPALAVPFCMGSSSALFSNAAAAIVAEPEKIFYLCRIHDDEAKDFLLAVSAVLRILKRKHLMPRVAFLIAYRCTGPEGWKDRLAEKISDVCSGFSVQVRMLHIDDDGEMAAAFADVLAGHRTHRYPLFAERNASEISAIIEQGGFYARRAVYCFDSLSMRFENCRRCDWLSYIRSERCITAGDLISLGRETGSIEVQPQFVGTYRELWARYRENPTVWRSLCGLIASAAERRDTLVRLHRCACDREQIKYHYILPAECLAAAGKLLELFQRNGVAAKGVVRSRDTLDGEIVFYAAEVNTEAMDELFGNPLLLMQPDGIFGALAGDGTMAIGFDHREIKNIPADILSDEHLALLRYFRDKGFIIHLRSNMGFVSFTCATRQCKRLLTSAERILEIYTYRKLKETVGFDDVRAGIHLRRIGTEGEEQLDMAVSRGFSSMIVECRDIALITPAYCEEFSRMAEQAGVNSRAVLIADECAGSLPPELKAEGAIPNVLLITREQDISDIGNVLLRLMSKKF